MTSFNVIVFLLLVAVVNSFHMRSPVQYGNAMHIKRSVLAMSQPDAETDQLRVGGRWAPLSAARKISPKLFLPLALPIPLMATLKASPVWAATSKAMAATSRKSSPQDLRAILASRTGPGSGKASLLQKIFLGVNAKGRLGNWRVGDTRTELSMLLNGLSMLAILGVWAAGAYIVQKREEHMDLVNLRKEVLREQEYRENMVFEAVEEITKRLTDPKLKSGTRASLQRQLRDLDPGGRVRDFLAGKSPRPDVHVLGNRDKKAAKGGSADGSTAASGATGRRRRPDSEEDTGVLGDDEDAGESPAGAGGQGRGQQGGDTWGRAESSTGSEQRGAAGDRSRERAEEEKEVAADEEESLFVREASQLGTDAAKILETLEELDGALRRSGRVDRAGRERVGDYLMQRFEAVYGDPAKRRVALQRVRERMDDLAYWQDLVQSL